MNISANDQTTHESNASLMIKSGEKKIFIEKSYKKTKNILLVIDYQWVKEIKLIHST